MINNLISLAKKENISLEVGSFIEKEYKVEILNDRLVQSNISKLTEYTIKALLNNKVVTLITEKINEPEKIIQTIKNNAALIDNDNTNRLCENDFEVSSSRDEKIDISYVKNELFKLTKYYHDKYPFIVNIDAIFDYDSITKKIDNENHHMTDKYSICESYFSISGEKNGVVKSESVLIYDKGFDLNRINDELEKIINKLNLSFDATSLKTNKYKVLIENDAVNKIINAFINTFYAKQLDMKTSPFSGKLGEKIFSDKISIVEEPVNEEFIVNKHFDGEGSLTYNKVVVENGVFKTALNSLEYAIKHNTKPTANSNLICNLHIKKGNKSYEELIAMLDNGIIIDNVEGLHAGINLNTGDISLQSTGLLVENGKIVKALNMIILQTSIQELLSNVLEVGSDLKEFTTSTSSVSLLLDDITISGNL